MPGLQLVRIDNLCDNKRSCAFFVRQLQSWRTFLMRKIITYGGTNMKPTKEMYTTLFNGITDARNYLKAVDEMLDNLQQKAEQLYMDAEEE